MRRTNHGSCQRGLHQPYQLRLGMSRLFKEQELELSGVGVRVEGDSIKHNACFVDEQVCGPQSDPLGPPVFTNDRSIHGAPP